jgi:hypothetical protein
MGVIEDKCLKKSGHHKATSWEPKIWGILGEGDGGRGYPLNRKQVSTVVLARSVQIGWREIDRRFEQSDFHFPRYGQIFLWPCSREKAWRQPGLIGRSRHGWQVLGGVTIWMGQSVRERFLKAHSEDKVRKSFSSRSAFAPRLKPNAFIHIKMDWMINKTFLAESDQLKARSGTAVQPESTQSFTGCQWDLALRPWNLLTSLQGLKVAFSSLIYLNILWTEPEPHALRLALHGRGGRTQKPMDIGAKASRYQS